MSFIHSKTFYYISMSLKKCIRLPDYLLNKIYSYIWRKELAKRTRKIIKNLVWKTYFKVFFNFVKKIKKFFTLTIFCMCGRRKYFLRKFIEVVKFFCFLYKKRNIVLILGFICLLRKLKYLNERFCNKFGIISMWFCMFIVLNTIDE